MSAHEAVEALTELGLSSYEARVFVALQRLGTGTAQAVSEVSDVPRSQVYGAADDLADRGLVEVVESSPKRYRAVGLAAAREQLREQVERTQAQAFENLEAIREDRTDRTDDGDVTTLHGRHTIDERVATLVGRATRQAMLVVAHSGMVEGDVAAALRDRAADGVMVAVVSDDPEVGDLFADDPVRVILADSDEAGGFTGRTLMVDDSTVLLSVETGPDHPEPFEETALWTADTSIGHILAEFVHAGMQAGLGGEFSELVEDPNA